MLLKGESSNISNIANPSPYNLGLAINTTYNNYIVDIEIVYRVNTLKLLLYELLEAEDGHKGNSNISDVLFRKNL